MLVAVRGQRREGRTQGEAQVHSESLSRVRGAHRLHREERMQPWQHMLSGIRQAAGRGARCWSKLKGSNSSVIPEELHADSQRQAGRRRQEGRVWSLSDPVSLRDGWVEAAMSGSC